MKLIPKKTFLLRQESIDGGNKKKDVVAHRGIAIEVTDAESVKFFGYFDFDHKAGEGDKKKVVQAAKSNKNLLRTV